MYSQPRIPYLIMNINVSVSSSTTLKPLFRSYRTIRKVPSFPNAACSQNLLLSTNHSYLIPMLILSRSKCDTSPTKNRILPLTREMSTELVLACSDRRYFRPAKRRSFSESLSRCCPLESSSPVLCFSTCVFLARTAQLLQRRKLFAQSTS
jgi:hypothetical protein